jgi:hypothetical protein
MMEHLDPYRSHSRWSDPGRWSSRLAAIPPEPATIVRAVSGLLLHPFIAPMRGVEIPPAAIDDRALRSVESILDRVHARDPRPLAAERPSAHRVFCVCAGFARLAASVFRTHAIPARCRVGFAAYFNPGFLEDHWVCEYRHGGDWRLLDAQLDDAAVRELGVDFAPTDVPRTQFVDASTTWRRVRAGEVDPMKVGLSPVGLAGSWMVVGNVLRDAAALNKEEMLPWEAWSVALQCGPGKELAPEWAERLDAVATLLGGTPDAALAERVYREHDWLRVTPTIVSYLAGGPVEVTVERP